MNKFRWYNIAVNRNEGGGTTETDYADVPGGKLIRTLTIVQNEDISLACSEAMIFIPIKKGDKNE